MRKYAAILLSALFLLVVSCGAKTKSELKAEAKLHEEYTVNDNYQAVYKRVVDKFVECSDGWAQYLQRDLYAELREGEMFMFGAGGDGYVFLVNIKSVEPTSTHVSSYSKITSGYYPLFMQMVRMGAYNQNGCPK